MEGKKLSYLNWSDEDVVKEMRRRLKEIKQTLIEIRELLRTLGS